MMTRRLLTAATMIPLVVMALALAPPAAWANIEGDVVYLFDTATTTTPDGSGNGNDGTLTNGPALSADTPFGYPGNRSMEFFRSAPDSASEHIVILDETTVDNVDLSNTSYTVEAWIKPDEIGNFQRDIWSNNGVRNFSNKGSTFSIAQSGQIRFTAQDGANPQFEVLSGAENVVSAGAWHHVAGVLDLGNNEMRVYLDGAQVGPATDITGIGDIHDNSPSESFRMAVGAEFFSASVNTTQSWDGKIDEFRLIRSVLSDAEILRNSQEPLIPEPATLALVTLGGLLALRRKR